MYHTDYLGRIDLHGRRTHAVARLVYRNLAAVGWIGRQIYVVHAIHAFGQFAVELKYHLFCQRGISGDIANTGTEHHFTVVHHLCHLYDSHVKATVSSISELLCQLRQMQIEIVGVVTVYTRAQIRCVLIGRTAVDGVGGCQSTIGPFVGRSPCKNINFKLPARFMLFYCSFRKGAGDYFG